MSLYRSTISQYVPKLNTKSINGQHYPWLVHNIKEYLQIYVAFLKLSMFSGFRVFVSLGFLFFFFFFFFFFDSLERGEKTERKQMLEIWQISNVQ